MKKIVYSGLMVAVLMAGLFVFPHPRPGVSAQAALDLYATIHAGGITVSIDSSDDPQHNLTAIPWYRSSGETAYREGFPLTRTSDTQLTGSLFWLNPGTTYEVQVRFSDPDGGALNNTSLSGSLTTRAEPGIPTPKTSYVVSPNGSGSTCSSVIPCSLTEALNQAQPGEAVLLRAGSYYQGEIDLPRSGTADAPIIIRSYGDETAILDGSDPGSFSWTAVGGGIYRTTVQAANPHLVVSDGQRLLPYQSYADLQNLIWDVSGFYADGTTLYVHLKNNASPASTQMFITRFNHAFMIERDHIIFDHLTFKHYGLGNYAKALYFYDASHNLVTDCTFHINDLSIGVKYESSENVFQNNTFSDTLYAWPWDAFYAGISLSGGGIRFYSPTSGRGNIIRGNTFHDYFDGFGACPETAGTQTNETDVYDNLVYRVGDDGMETDGTCANVRIWNNTFHDVLVGISLAPVYDGPVYAVRNLIYNTGLGNNNYSGTPFKFNSGYDPSGTMYLFHNTADAAQPFNNGLYVKAPGSWDLIYARNNIWSGTEYAINNYNETEPIDLDYDNLYTTRTDEFVYWGNESNRHMRDLLTFQTLTGQEMHGLNEVSGFFDAGNGDYTLTETSPLINQGLHIPGINDGYLGSAPDIGAFEYEGYGVKTSVSPGVLQLEPGESGTVNLSFTALGGYDEMVLLSVSSPDPALSTSLSKDHITAPDTAELFITDSHSLPLGSFGLWFSVPLTVSGPDFEETINIPVLVGGEQIYLPLIAR